MKRKGLLNGIETSINHSNLGIMCIMQVCTSTSYPHRSLNISICQPFYFCIHMHLLHLYPECVKIFIFISTYQNLGFKVVISLACMTAFFYQSVLLVNNYRERNTLFTDTETLVSEKVPASNIIFCTDPPHRNKSEKLVRTALEEPNKSFITSNMETLFKVSQHFNISLVSSRPHNPYFSGNI